MFELPLCGYQYINTPGSRIVEQIRQRKPVLKKHFSPLHGKIYIPTPLYKP